MDHHLQTSLAALMPPILDIPHMSCPCQAAGWHSEQPIRRDRVGTIVFCHSPQSSHIHTVFQQFGTVHTCYLRKAIVVIVETSRGKSDSFWELFCEPRMRVGVIHHDKENKKAMLDLVLLRVPNRIQHVIGGGVLLQTTASVVVEERSSFFVLDGMRACALIEYSKKCSVL